MYSVLGILGSFFCLVALCLTIFVNGFGSSAYYKILNILGGGCLLIYSISLGAVPFIVLEFVWTLSSAVGLIRNRLL